MAFLVFGFRHLMQSFALCRANNGYRLNTNIKQEYIAGFCRHWENENTFFSTDTENLNLSMTVGI